MRKKLLNSTKRIVIKIGSSLLINKNGSLNKKFIRSIVEQVSELVDDGKDVALVSSGAIGLGMMILGMEKRPVLLPQLQACAAIGQGKLMNAYEAFFSKKNLHAAQILLTKEDLVNRTRYLNARNTLNALFSDKVVPIINENDTVSVEEIKFGDNDTLSALVSSLMEADLLIILTNTEGFYITDCNGKKCLMSHVEQLDADIRSHAKGSKGRTTVGGMVTKLDAAEIVATSGANMIIANGNHTDVIKDIMKAKDIGTLFERKVKKLDAKKRWLAFSLSSKGKIVVDKGAEDVLKGRGRSLLASGIKDVSGRFSAGDCVSICDERGKEFAKGLSNYSDVEVSKIKGLKSADIADVLGAKFFDEVIHRNNMVVL